MRIIIITITITITIIIIIIIIIIVRIIIIIIINDNFYSALSKSSKALYNQGEKLKIIIKQSFIKITFKICAYSSRSGRKSIRSLRLSSRNLLVIPRSTLKSYCDRAFSVSAPKLWKDISETIKCSVDLNACKRNLKTFLFNSMYIHEF